MPRAIQSQWTISKIISVAFRLFLGCIFLAASYDKMLHPQVFAEIVYNYRILPDMLINLTAIGLPWLELILAILLISGIWLPGAVLISNMVLISFFASLVFNMARGLDISCGCFSTNPQSESVNYSWYILRELSFVLAGLYLFAYEFFRGPAVSREPY
ncbi:MAG: DoxX family protein [Desulfobacterales bacterium]|nr:DoxX family protein [Desulfobacterales bacterium]MDD4071518.1 DoxX family protein [Desulfobacterales bacterium]MDD4391804.1 DoxX family protein [Desulfobacterales bacterium]